MHSSRMRTARLHIVPGGGRCCDLERGGVLWPGQGGGVVTWTGGVLWPGQGGGRCCDLARGGRPLVLPTPSPGVEVTHACENITFARFATRAVKITKFNSNETSHFKCYPHRQPMYVDLNGGSIFSETQGIHTICLSLILPINCLYVLIKFHCACFLSVQCTGNPTTPGGSK